MKILGIESSCDDTSVAMIDATDKKIEILAELTASQIEVHKKYGGVVPEIAGRKHAEKILPLIEEVMKSGEQTLRKTQGKPDAIAVTSGPGLMTGLLVGMEAAKSLSYLWDIPLVRVNHIEGHIYSVLLKTPNTKIQKTIIFPALCLIVSGGHTELILMKSHGDYELLGKTRDDAAGECFDKVAKLLNLPYPGGPQISKLAETGNPHAIPFPRPMIDDDSFDFSFSGLKTASLYWLRDNKLSAHKNYWPTHLLHAFGMKKAEHTIHDFSASFEQSIVDVLTAKTIRAVKKYQPKTIILGGGVSANKKLKETLQAELSKQSSLSTFYFPLSTYSMDNATMIALAGYYHARKKEYTPWDKLIADPNWKIYE